MPESNPPHRVVVVGGGFGGLSAVRRLRRAPVEVTLVDRRNFHLFQPLLYQVATGALSPGEIASPLRGILKRQDNARVVLAEVADLDLETREVMLAPDAAGEVARLPYDTLIVAAGARHAYFGHDEWEPLAPGLKTLEDALEIRRRVLVAFEAAEVERDEEDRRSWLTFVVVGGGPTGVELAGQIAEIARDTVRRDYRHIDPTSARVLLVEGAGRLLTAYPESLSEKARRQLEALGATTMLRSLVVGVDPGGVTLSRAGGATERIPTRTIVWAAGVSASPLGAVLAHASGADLDSAGRITVEPDLTLPGRPEVLALGDMVRVSDGAGGTLPLPGVAQPAIQEGRYAAEVVRARLAGADPPGPFHYRDKGNMATIGRRAAVADIKGIRISGLPAWLAWLFVHLLYLNGLQNRAIVFLRWCGSFLTHGRGARLITGEGLESAHPESRPHPPR